MRVHVTVHVDLRPEAHRRAFNERMERAGWAKQLDIFTLWYQAFEAASFDTARAAAIASVSDAANASVVELRGAAVIAGNGPPVEFRTEPARTDDVSYSDILRLSGR